jgi:tRNA threonylcarbamoyladenosine modification (KEOPS) complex  Pcc1 subunit
MQKPKINGDLEDADGMMRLYLEVKAADYSGNKAAIASTLHAE